MFDKLIHILPSHRHRFRHMTFDELSELYTSVMLRSLVMGMAGIFIPVYLYQNGYEIWQIFSFYAVSWAVQSLVIMPVGKLIGKYGPKHVILVSFLIQAVSLLLFVNIERISSIYFLAAVFGLANIMFFVAFHVDFSKVKHKRSSGKEVGISYAMERTGAVLGPLVGGLIAYLFAPEYIFVFAVAVALLGAFPLLMTNEPTMLNQKIDYSKVKLRTINRDLVSYGALTISIATSMIIWPLFIGVIVFTENPYIQIGSIATVSILISVIVARNIGKMVDNKKGRTLLRFNAFLGAGLSIFRPFTSGYPMAMGVNLINDAVVPGYRMPYMKGMYDAADDHPGSRIAYIAIMELGASIARSSFFLLLAFSAYFTTADRLFFGVVFFIGGLATMLVTLERFSALKSKRLRFL